jgi:hypothetical protein
MIQIIVKVNVQLSEGLFLFTRIEKKEIHAELQTRTLFSISENIDIVISIFSDMEFGGQ